MNKAQTIVSLCSGETQMPALPVSLSRWKEITLATHLLLTSFRSGYHKKLIFAEPRIDSCISRSQNKASVF